VTTRRADPDVADDADFAARFQALAYQAIVE
jgi:hypothetical protein